MKRCLTPTSLRKPDTAPGLQFRMQGRCKSHRVPLPHKVSSVVLGNLVGLGPGKGMLGRGWPRAELPAPWESGAGRGCESLPFTEDGMLAAWPLRAGW